MSKRMEKDINNPEVFWNTFMDKWYKKFINGEFDVNKIEVDYYFLTKHYKELEDYERCSELTKYYNSKI